MMQQPGDEQQSSANLRGSTAADNAADDPNRPLLPQREAAPSAVSRFLACLVQTPQAIGGALAGTAKWFWNHPTVSVMALTAGVNGVACAAVHGKLGTEAEKYSNEGLDAVRNNKEATMGVVFGATMFASGLLASTVGRYRADAAAAADQESTVPYRAV